MILPIQMLHISKFLWQSKTISNRVYIEENCLNIDPRTSNHILYIMQLMFLMFQFHLNCLITNFLRQNLDLEYSLLSETKEQISLRLFQGFYNCLGY